MKAVIYARYSSDSQREESIEGQIRECTAFAEKNGIMVLRHYIDRAFSAKTDNRPEFQNMIKDSNKKLFDTVIVWKLDRFARNRYDSARHKATLKKNGVKVVSATEAIADGSVGIMMETILEGMAEYYSVDLSEKVVRGMTDNALKCMFNGGTLPIGYIIDKEQHFQIDPVTSPFVLAAFEKYADGATMTEVRDYLNENGVTNTRGKPMTYNSVQHLLNNRRYIGEYVYREIVVPDGIPAIVPLDLFERVQEKMAKNKKAPARHKAEDDYLLTTKLFCGHCGAYMCGESGTSRTGVVHHYYKCVSVKKKRAECHKKPVKKRWIEDLVVAEAMKMVMNDDVVDAIVSMLMDLQGRENTNLPLYQQQLKETETKIENLLKAITEGVFTKSTKTLLEELEAAKEELENRISLEKLEKPQISEEFMRFWLHRFRKLDMAKKEHRQMLIDVFINAIFLYDDKMLITFNYKEGTKTITFNDVKNEVSEETSGSDLDCSSAPKLDTCFDTIWYYNSVWFFLFDCIKLLHKGLYMSIEEIIALFHKEMASEYTLKCIRLDEHDSRWILYVNVDHKKYVIKIASNGFTTAERIRGWVDIIAEYQKMGYYSPAILKSLRGKYSETIQFNEKCCVVWEEEYAKYSLRDSLDKTVYTGTDGIYVYHDEVLAFIAKIAEKHFSNFPYPSGWVRFEPFGADETMDEVSECVETFGELVSKKTPDFLSRWNHIRSLFEENKQKLREIYNSLPTSVFQADEAGNNLILDDNGHFLGVIDYNLAGKDVVINRFLSTILFGYSYRRKETTDPHLLPELNPETQNSVIEIILDSLRKLRQHYTFSEIEAQAAPLLFKYISCIEYTQIDALEKYAHDHDKLQQLFDFMEHELLREDIDFRGAMLN